jgi:hypothetical protein
MISQLKNSSKFSSKLTLFKIKFSYVIFIRMALRKSGTAPVALKLLGANKHFACSAKGQHQQRHPTHGCRVQHSIFERYHHHNDFSRSECAIIRHQLNYHCFVCCACFAGVDRGFSLHRANNEVVKRSGC